MFFKQDLVVGDAEQIIIAVQQIYLALNFHVPELSRKDVIRKAVGGQIDQMARHILAVCHPRGRGVENIRHFACEHLVQRIPSVFSFSFSVQQRRRTKKSASVTVGRPVPRILCSVVDDYIPYWLTAYMNL